MKRYLIKRPFIVNNGHIFQSDVYIKDGLIDKIDTDLYDKADEVIDAEGLYLFPGMIDEHVHFREPGMTHKAEIATDSRAAVAGGITSCMEMPNCSPPTVKRSKLLEKKESAFKKSHVNFAFYLGATNDNLKEIQSLQLQDACGVKVFMGASTGNMLVDDPEVLEKIFETCPFLIATHCEDTPMIKANEEHYKNIFGEAIPVSMHPAIRSEDACYASSSLAVKLATKHQAKLHILHLTTQIEMDLFTNDIPLKDKLITAEACVHHLFFNNQDYNHKGSLIKCNPAIKQESDRKALINSVNNDLIDAIATDHAPHLYHEKANAYLKAPSGLPLVQDALLSLLEHYHDDIFSLEKIVDKIAHAPAEIYQVSRRGYIQEGYWADLVLVDLSGSTARKASNCLYKCGWSPFDHLTFRSSIEKTFVNGELKYSDGKIISSRKGQALLFNH
jgi:dihydroorotase